MFLVIFGCSTLLNTNVGYNNAIFIKNVRSYKSFYFGVLNKK